MKKVLALLLTAMLAVSAFAGCTQSTRSADSKAETETSSEMSPKTTPESVRGFSDRDDISYVMIYNPDTFNPNSEINTTLSTGDFSKWIDTGTNRAGDEQQAEPKYGSVAQKSVKELLGGKDIDFPEDRAGFIQNSYKVGQVKKFNYEETNGEFECMYAGDKCNVWILTSVTAGRDEAEKIGKEFDEKIYDKDVEMFGEPRYADEGGKIQLLFHPMSQEGVLGYFNTSEILTTTEAIYLDCPVNSLNLDDGYLHINAAMLGKNLFTIICSTLAHEFQHMINASDLFEGGTGFADVWLNEAMSGYAEEKLYPGSQKEEGYDLAIDFSGLVRHGQSMYNFNTTDEYDMLDVGVYGSVYLFAEYLADRAGEDVFHSIHDNFRQSPASNQISMQLPSTAEILAKSVPESFYQEIDEKYTYSADIQLDSKGDEWVSKLLLDFYLTVVASDAKAPAAFTNFYHIDFLLYDEIGAADLEGGGRVIFATKSGEFDVPANADKPLVYIGFDKDFKPVTDAVFQ